MIAAKWMSLILCLLVGSAVQARDSRLTAMGISSPLPLEAGDMALFEGQRVEVFQIHDQGVDIVIEDENGRTHELTVPRAKLLKQIPPPVGSQYGMPILFDTTIGYALSFYEDGWIRLEFHNPYRISNDGIDVIALGPGQYAKAIADSVTPAGTVLSAHHDIHLEQAFENGMIQVSYGGESRANTWERSSRVIRGSTFPRFDFRSRRVKCESALMRN